MLVDDEMKGERIGMKMKKMRIDEFMEGEECRKKVEKLKKENLDKEVIKKLKEGGLSIKKDLENWRKYKKILWIRIGKYMVEEEGFKINKVMI